MTGAPSPRSTWPWLRDQADITIGDQTYTALRESVLEGTYSLQSGDETLARAQRISLFRRGFEIDFAGQRLTVKPAGFWGRQFNVLANDFPVGLVRRSRWFGRSADIELPEELPLAVQIFLFWLVAILWRRASNSSNSSAMHS